MPAMYLHMSQPKRFWYLYIVIAFSSSIAIGIGKPTQIQSLPRSHTQSINVDEYVSMGVYWRLICMYSKAWLKPILSKVLKIGFQDQLSLNAG